MKMTKYELLNKNSFNQFINVMSSFSVYDISLRGSKSFSEYYFDTEEYLLSGADVILSETCYSESSHIKIELDKSNSKSYLENQFQTLCVEKDIEKNKSIFDNLSFLADGFQTVTGFSLNIDAQVLLKRVKPFMELKVNQQNYNIFTGLGLEVLLVYQQFKIINSRTNKKKDMYILYIDRLDSRPERDKDFNLFMERVKAKGIMLFETSNSDYSIASRITRKEIMKQMIEDNGEQLMEEASEEDYE